MVILQAKDLSVSIQSKNIFENVSFEILENRQYAIVGPSGSGKTILLRCLVGQQFYKGTITISPAMDVILVEQQHHFKNLSNTSSFYYQQRFNSMDAEDAMTVREYLQNLNIEKEDAIFRKLNLSDLFEKRLIQLSNGENKKLHLAIALQQKPGILLLDNPFLGLDNKARETISKILETVVENSVSVVMVTSPGLIPGLVTDVLDLTKNGVSLWTKENFLKNHCRQPLNINIDKALLTQLISDDKPAFDFAVKIKDVHVQYGKNIILDRINWQVRRGERWALSGPNGAGKSTLLSLMNADNPQAYANEIYLFDKRRGRGESIWDIKKRIGYVSPELHLYFDSSIITFDVIASGLFDTIGLFRLLSEEQTHLIQQWIKLLHLEELATKLLANLPLGKQRLVLLARALVKNPPLLILDEPAQGLDEEQTALFKNIIEQICAHSEKTLIYVTHLKEEVPSSVTQFMRLEKGKAVSNR